MTQTDRADYMIETPEEAQMFAAAATTTIDDLRIVLAEETEHLMAARLKDAIALSDRKAGLADSYSRYMATLETSGARLRELAPEAAEQLAASHNALAETAARNLPTVERARDTTLRVIKGVNALIEKKRVGPTIYDPNAVEETKQPGRAAPISLDTAV